MGGDRSIRALVGASPSAARVVRPIVRDWRRLSGGSSVRDNNRKTLIACSGGVDSMALTLALASASPHLAIAHIIHDMRPRSEALASRDAAKDLATRLDLPFFEQEIAAKAKGHNYEARARTLRYAALESIAKDHACPFIATAHHADDQLETVLMRLLRGSGPQGLAGFASSRRLPDGSRLIRPMLAITRDDAVTLCHATHTDWVEDTTNRDESHLRSALRHRVIPLLKDLEPRASEAAGRSAGLLHQTTSLLAKATDDVFALGIGGGGWVNVFQWNRETLRTQPPIVLGEVIRRSAHTFGVTARADQRGSKALSSVLVALRDNSTEPRDFTIGGLSIAITTHNVTIRPLPSPQ